MQMTRDMYTAQPEEPVLDKVRKYILQRGLRKFYNYTQILQI